MMADFIYVIDDGEARILKSTSLAEISRAFDQQLKEAARQSGTVKRRLLRYDENDARAKVLYEYTKNGDDPHESEEMFPKLDEP